MSLLVCLFSSLLYGVIRVFSIFSSHFPSFLSSVFLFCPCSFFLSCPFSSFPPFSSQCSLFFLFSFSFLSVVIFSSSPFFLCLSFSSSSFCGCPWLRLRRLRGRGVCEVTFACACECARGCWRVRVRACVAYTCPSFQHLFLLVMMPARTPKTKKKDRTAQNRETF